MLSPVHFLAMCEHVGYTKPACSFFKELTLEARRTVVEDKMRDRSMDEAVDIIDSNMVCEVFAANPLAEGEIREWIAAQAWPTEGPLARRLGDTDPFEGFGLPMVTISNGVRSDPTKACYNRDKARRHLERAVDLRSIHLGPNDLKTLDTVRQLGKTLLYIDVAKGFQVISDGLARSAATFGPDDDMTLRFKDLLATAYEVANKPDEALLLWKEVYTRTNTKLGRDSNAALIRSDSLAAAYEKAGHIKEALLQREESLRGRRKLASGLIDFSVGRTVWEVARLYDLVQDHARAEPLWREALFVYKDSLYFMADLQTSLGACLLKGGRPAQAEPVLRECLAIRENQEPNLWTTFNTRSMLGAALLGQKKYIDAEPLLLAGYEGMKKEPGQNPAEKQDHLIETLERLVQLYEATDKKDKAEAWRKKLQEAKAAAKDPTNP